MFTGLFFKKKAGVESLFRIGLGDAADYEERPAPVSQADAPDEQGKHLVYNVRGRPFIAQAPGMPFDHLSPPRSPAQSLLIQLPAITRLLLASISNTPADGHSATRGVAAGKDGLPGAAAASASPAVETPRPVRTRSASPPRPLTPGYRTGSAIKMGQAQLAEEEYAALFRNNLLVRPPRRDEPSGGGRQ
eukprot:6209605-Pleurochrysis_carterae.AAC.4